MKSSFFVIVGTILFIFLGVLNHDKINEFSNTYLEEFNTIELNIKNENWNEASTMLLNVEDQLDTEKNTWYKLINHGYFNEIFASIQILKQSINLKNKMISLQELEKIMENVHIIEKNSTDSVFLGTTVKIEYIEEDDDETEEYMIVGSKEADPSNNKISNESPLAKAIMNAKAGDIRAVESPNGTYNVKVVEIL